MMNCRVCGKPGTHFRTDVFGSFKRWLRLRCENPACPGRFRYSTWEKSKPANGVLVWMFPAKEMTRCHRP